MEASGMYQLHPMLIAAVIYQESKGESHAMRYEPRFYSKYLESKIVKKLPGYYPREALASGLVSEETEKRLRAFSFGLMQIMGQTARENGFKDMCLAELLDPKKNIMLGCKILAKHLEEAQGDIEKALLRYNGGANKDYAFEVLSHRDSTRCDYILRM